MMNRDSLENSMNKNFIYDLFKSLDEGEPIVKSLSHVEVLIDALSKSMDEANDIVVDIGNDVTLAETLKNFDGNAETVSLDKISAEINAKIKLLFAAVKTFSDAEDKVLAEYKALARTEARAEIMSDAICVAIEKYPESKYPDLKEIKLLIAKTKWREK